MRIRQRTFLTFHAGLSRAVARLLPEQAANRDRLLGTSLRSPLATAVLDRMEKTWLEPALARLRPFYTVSRAEITAAHASAYGQDEVNGEPLRENALFVLTRDGFPPSFQDWVILPFREEKVQHVTDYLTAAGRLEDLALSLPWLHGLRRRESPVMYLQFAGGRSFSDKAMRAFAQDMMARGRPELVDLVAGVPDQVALLVVNGVHLVILPDTRAILWRFYDSPANQRPVLRWAREVLSGVPCVTNPAQRELCVGAIISPQGEIMP